MNTPSPNLEARSRSGPTSNLVNVAFAVYRRRRLALLACTGGLLVTALYAWVSPPMYEARARLLLELDSISFAFSQLNASDRLPHQESYRTEYARLRSRSLARRTLDTLRRSAPDGARVDTDLAIPGDDPDAIDAFLARLTVTPIRQSHLVDVSFRMHDPVLAARIVNTLIDEYIAVVRHERGWHHLDDLAAAAAYARLEHRARQALLARFLDARPQADIGMIAMARAELEAMNRLETRLTAALDAHVDRMAGGRADQLGQPTEAPARLWGGATGLVWRSSGDIRVVDPAETPTRPVSPNPWTLVVLGGILGAAVGVGLALVAEAVDPRLRTPEDLEASTGLPTLGMWTDRPEESLDDDAVQRLRVVVMSHLGETPSSLLVTSVAGDDGRNSVALDLAQSLAALGQRTLLVDANPADPPLRETLGVASASGPSEVIAGDAESGLAASAAAPNLWVVSCRRRGDRRVDASDGPLEAMTRAVESYTWVIVDGPAVLPSAEASALAHAATATLLTVRSESTKRTDARRAVDQLLLARARLLGGVITRVNPTRHPLYYARYETPQQPASARRSA